MSPSGPFSDRVIMPPAARPLASRRGKAGGGDGRRLRLEQTSFRPKNCEKPAPPRGDGVVASSCTTMPLPPVAEIESWPLAKLADAVGAQRGVQRGGETADGGADAGGRRRHRPIRVPAPKSTSTRDTRLPLESVTAMVVLPVKLSASVESRPGVAAGQRGRRRIGGIGIGLGVEGHAPSAAPDCPGSGQARPAPGRACRSGPSASRPTDADPARWAEPIRLPLAGLMSWMVILP